MDLGSISNVGAFLNLNEWAYEAIITNFTFINIDRFHNCDISAKFDISNFNLDEFGVFTETPLDKTVSVEFTADKVGEFIYYCTKPGHRANGHWGTLKVVE